MIIQLTTTQWLALPMEVRMKLKQIFGIPRTTGTVMQDNVVLSDGHTHNDLLAISVEKMQEFVDSKQKDFYKLFELTLAKVEEEVKPKTNIPVVAESVIPPLELLVEHNGKTYKLVEVGLKPEVAPNEPLYPTQPKSALTTLPPVAEGAGAKGKGGAKKRGRRAAAK